MKADSGKVLQLLRTARGQIEGIIKMVEDNRYCLEISSQVLACGAVLKRANSEIIGAHMQSCVAGAIGSGDSSQAEKHIAELMDLFTKLNG